MAIGEDVSRKRAGSKDIFGVETAKYLQHRPEMDHAQENLHKDYRANYASNNMNSLLKQQSNVKRSVPHEDLQRIQPSVNFATAHKNTTLDPSDNLYHRRNGNSDQVGSAMMQYYGQR